jgi:hypothetical protein
MQIAEIERNTFDQTPSTAAQKNEDMPKIPHPFIFNDLTDHTVVMLDPNSPESQSLMALHHSQENVPLLLHQGYVKIGNDAIKRAGPPGVMVVSHKFKNTKG